MYNEQVRRGQVSEKAKFEYAWCLVRSKYIDDMKEGVALLEGTDKRCPIYQYCVLHHSLQISYSKSLSLPYIACIICHGQFFSISLRPLISYSMEKFVSHALELQFLILTYKRLPNLRSTKTSNAKFIFFFHGCHMILVVLHMNLDYFICMSKENPSCGNNFERHFFSS